MALSRLVSPMATEPLNHIEPARDSLAGFFFFYNSVKPDIRTCALCVIPVRVCLRPDRDGNQEYRDMHWIPAFAGMTEEKVGKIMQMRKSSISISRKDIPSCTSQSVAMSETETSARQHGLRV